jgi:hypothetical protein
MFAIEVVVGDVGLDGLQRGGMVFVFGHFEFCLECSEARFHEGVVVAVVGPTHALTHRGTAHHTAVSRACILAAAICMVNQVFTWPSCSDGRRQRV